MKQREIVLSLWGMKRIWKVFLFVLIVSQTSCRYLYPNLMFQQRDYKYLELAKKQVKSYVIEAGDQLTVQVFSRDGFRILDIIGMTGVENTGSRFNNLNQRQMGMNFLVDQDGFVKLPIFGNIYVQGYTEPELEYILEEKLSALYVEPFVVLTVINRRAFVFVGSNAQIVSLNQAPTKLIEVIAKAGGIPDNLKAYKIRLIRGDLQNPSIKLIDLSTLDGIKDADLIVQSNDILYVEPRRRITLDIWREVAPYLGIATSFSTFLLLLTR